MAAERQAMIAALRATLERLDGSGRRAAAAVGFGLPAIEAALPGHGLARGALHGIEAADHSAGSAALGFAVTLLAGLATEGPVLWCLAPGSGETQPYGPGLAQRGLDPGRLILVRPRDEAGLAQAMEEGLRSPGLTAVLGEPRGLDLTRARRLQLAAEASGGLGLVLTAGPGTPGSGVAVTRWQVATALSDPVPLGPAQEGIPRARARWRVRLLRCRGRVLDPALADQMISDWLVEVDDAAGPVAVPWTMADRPAAAARRRGAGGRHPGARHPGA